MSVRDVWASAFQQLRQDNVHLQLEIHDLQNTLASMWSHAGISIPKPELHIQAPEARGTFSDRREELWQLLKTYTTVHNHVWFSRTVSFFVDYSSRRIA